MPAYFIFGKYQIIPHGLWVYRFLIYEYKAAFSIDKIVLDDGLLLINLFTPMSSLSKNFRSISVAITVSYRFKTYA